MSLQKLQKQGIIDTLVLHFVLKQGDSYNKERRSCANVANAQEMPLLEETNQISVM